MIFRNVFLSVLLFGVVGSWCFGGFLRFAGPTGVSAFFWGGEMKGEVVCLLLIYFCGGLTIVLLDQEYYK